MNNERTDEMIKLFISQPMNGRTDDEILTKRYNAITIVKMLLGNEIEVLDTFFTDFDQNTKPLSYLARSIDILAKADIACFVRGWEYSRGCKIEYQCAINYGISVIDFNEININGGNFVNLDYSLSDSLTMDKDIGFAVDYLSTITPSPQIKNIKIIVPNKVVEIEFEDRLKEKMVCAVDDTFNLEKCCYIAIAKHLYKHKCTQKGIEYMAEQLQYYKLYEKIVTKAIKKYYKEETEKNKMIAEEEERKLVLARKREKRRKQKERRRERQDALKQKEFEDNIKLAIDVINQLNSVADNQ